MSGRAFALLGPTASGKSRLALELAQKLPLEIVSIDSAQVYRGMDIGTAKPDARERAKVPHHLIDILNPNEAYSAARWRADAIRIVQEILQRKKIPLLVGGTMLYYRGLAQGLDALPEADPGLRAEIDADAARRGWPALHAELAKVDAASARRIAPNDSQRIQRALEVWRLTGAPLSSLHGGARPELPFELQAFSLVPERDALHRRIAERFDSMLKAGLVEELRALKNKYTLSETLPSMRSVGYRQAWEFLEGRYDADTLKERGTAATRQLAKRQLTWLRSLPEVERIEPAAGALSERIHSFLSR